MNIRTSSCLASSLSTAAFRLVLGRDQRGLAYRRRRQIMTLRLLRQDPVPAGFGLAPRGRIATARNIKTMSSSRIRSGVRT